MGKIHCAIVTEANLDYEGSVGIDSALMRAAGIFDGEAVSIWNVTRGSRLTTYAIEAPAGSGTIAVNGAGTNLTHPGDLVILACFAYLSEARRASTGRAWYLWTRTTISSRRGPRGSTSLRKDGEWDGAPYYGRAAPAAIKTNTPPDDVIPGILADGDRRPKRLLLYGNQ